MKDNILVFIPTGLNSPESQVLVSTAQILINKKKNVTLLVCKGGDKYSCAKNILSIKLICNLCKYKRDKLINTLKGDYKIIETPAIKNVIFQKKFINFKKLKNYYYRGMDNGLATYSSYITNTRDKNLEGFIATRIILKNLNTTNLLSDFYYNLLKNFFFSEVYSYNSRMNLYRPLLRASSALKIKFNNLETIHDNRSLKVINLKDAIVNDYDKIPKLINNYWKKNPSINRSKIVKKFFLNIKKFNKQMEQPRSYLADQRYGILPSNFNKKKYNITFFVSSEDEYETVIKKNYKPIFKDQLDCILEICKIITNKQDFILWIRMHPNLTGLNWSYVANIYNFEKLYNNVFVIKPDSEISTHAIMRDSNLILGLRSRTLLESVYINKPTISLGNSYWSRLGPFNTILTKKKLKKLILSRNVRPLSNLAAKKYAFFFSKSGKKIKYITGGYHWSINKRKVKIKFKFKKNFVNYNKIQNITYYSVKIVEKLIFYLNYKLS
jgi:hypothetical protein